MLLRVCCLSDLESLRQFALRERNRVGLEPVVQPAVLENGVQPLTHPTRGFDLASRGESRSIASCCCASLLIGAYVLDSFGLSVPVVQLAGGLVVCSLAWSLLGQSDEPLEWMHDAAKPLGRRPDLRTRAFYPLTMPLTVGSGSISVAITIGANELSRGVATLIVDSLAHPSGVFVVALAVFVTLRYADRIMRRLGPTGTAVLLRMSAFILLCIGVQIMWNGLAALLRTHGIF